MSFENTNTAPNQEAEASFADLLYADPDFCEAMAGTTSGPDDAKDAAPKTVEKVDPLTTETDATYGTAKVTVPPEQPQPSQPSTGTVATPATGNVPAGAAANRPVFKPAGAERSAISANGMSRILLPMDNPATRIETARKQYNSVFESRSVKQTLEKLQKAKDLGLPALVVLSNDRAGQALSKIAHDRTGTAVVIHAGVQQWKTLKDQLSLGTDDSPRLRQPALARAIIVDPQGSASDRPLGLRTPLAKVAKEIPQPLPANTQGLKG